MVLGLRMWAISLLSILLLLPLLSAAPLDIAGDIKKVDVKADNDGMHSHDENVTRGGKFFAHNQFDIRNISISGSVAGDVVSIGHQVKIDVHGHTHDHHHHEADSGSTGSLKPIQTKPKPVIECKEGIRELFKSIDSNKNGLVDTKELLRVCHQNNIHITESLAERISSLPDKTVGLNLANFCELLKDSPSTNSADFISFLLQLFDKVSGPLLSEDQPQGWTSSLLLGSTATNNEVTCHYKDDLSSVLLENNWRTQDEIDVMSEEDKRNTVLVEVEKMTGHTTEDLQRRANAEDLGSLASIANMAAFLIKYLIRSSSEVKTMTYEPDLRNTLIVEINKRFSTQISQSMTDHQLLKKFFEEGGKCGQCKCGQTDAEMQSPSRRRRDLPEGSSQVICPYKDDLSSVLLENNWKTQDEIDAMSEEDKRSTVLVEVGKMTDRIDLQGRAIAGKLGSLTAIANMASLLIKYFIRPSTDVKTMTYDDLRNTLIVETSKRYSIQVAFQSMTDHQLLKKFCTVCTVSGPCAVYVGKSDSNIKRATVGERCECPEKVDKENWAGGLRHPDKFAVTQNGKILKVQRMDSNGGWGMDLVFKCKHTAVDVDGGWSNWSKYGLCSKNCGGGHQMRTRTCTNPVPQNKGRTCEQQNIGDPTETKDCNLHACAVDGGWSNWSKYGLCSKNCGGGQQKRTRTCTNPVPQNKGRTCIGDSTETKDCNLHDCGYIKTPGINLEAQTSLGEWGEEEKCSYPHFVKGMEIKFEGQGIGFQDDTSLNAIRLTCSDGRTISSTVGHFGSWGSTSTCPEGEFINQAIIRSEKFDPDEDNTAANGIRFRCTDGSEYKPEKGNWGKWIKWKYCQPGSAVYGIQTLVQRPMGSDTDDTALNNVKFLCAQLPKNGNSDEPELTFFCPSGKKFTSEKSLVGIRQNQNCWACYKEAGVDGCSSKVYEEKLDQYFGASCDIHDLCYTYPGRSKSDCDNEQFNNMIQQCGSDMSTDDSGCWWWANNILSLHSETSASDDAYKDAQNDARGCTKTKN